MNTTFTADKETNEITPVYGCGLRGPVVSTDRHGADYAVLRLIEDHEVHSIKCWNCNGVQPNLPAVNTEAAKILLDAAHKAYNKESENNK